MTRQVSSTLAVLAAWSVLVAHVFATATQSSPLTARGLASHGTADTALDNSNRLNRRSFASVLDMGESALPIYAPALDLRGRADGGVLERRGKGRPLTTEEKAAVKKRLQEQHDKEAEENRLREKEQKEEAERQEKEAGPSTSRESFTHPVEMREQADGQAEMDNRRKKKAGAGKSEGRSAHSAHHRRKEDLLSNQESCPRPKGPAHQQHMHVAVQESERGQPVTEETRVNVNGRAYPLGDVRRHLQRLEHHKGVGTCAKCLRWSIDVRYGTTERDPIATTQRVAVDTAYCIAWFVVVYELGLIAIGADPRRSWLPFNPT